MAWQGILGHDAVAEKFRRASARGRLAGSFLFIGNAGVGKRRFAVALAKTLLCKSRPPDAADIKRFLPCGECQSCKMFPESVLDDHPVAHPDFFLIAKPEGKATLPLELLIGDKEHRGKAGLCFEISRTPFLGGKKVAVIDDADFFKEEPANALLKTLEEPPPDSLLILLGTAAAKQLPTIRSRCQIVRFAALSNKNLASILHDRGMVDSLETGLRIAKRAEGGLEAARELLDPALEPMREELVKMLADKKCDAVTTAARINEFVGKTEKDANASQPRARLRFLLLAALDFQRETLRKTERAHGADDVPGTVRSLECTFDALEQVDRNVILPYVVDVWAEKMKRRG